MALTREDREEIIEIVKEVVENKESPEGRLVVLETKVDHLIRDQEELRSEIRDIRSVLVTKDELRLLIEGIYKRFEDVDKRFQDMNKRLDFQGKLLFWILGAILTTVVLYGGLIIFLIGKL